MWVLIFGFTSADKLKVEGAADTVHMKEFWVTLSKWAIANGVVDKGMCL